MVRRLAARLRRSRADERGTETIAALFVVPVVFVLILGLIEVGMMLRTRMLVENVLRDAVRRAAADGGNYNTRVNTTKPWDTVATEALVDSRTGRCKHSKCDPGSTPKVDCTLITRPNGTTYRSQVAQNAGDLITCTVTYRYAGINEALLNTPGLGLGLGSLIKDFTVSSSARAEVGVSDS